MGGHALRVAVTGHGSPCFVCLHGLVDTLEIWDRLAEPLGSRGRLVRFDQRAHGGSQAPPGPYRREDLAGDVLALLDGLEIPRAVLVAHSMGGVVAMTSALEHSDRIAGLVLIGTASQCSERVAGWYERIARAGEQAGTAGLAGAIYGDGAPRKVEGDAGGIAALTRMLASLHPDPLTPKLCELRCPVLLLVGERDPMGPKASEIIARQLPDAELEVLPDCGHWVHVEAADRLLASLDRWLAGHPALSS